MTRAYAAVVALSALAGFARQDGGDALRKTLKDVDLVGNWVYDDLAAGYTEAKKTGKPMLVVFR